MLWVPHVIILKQESVILLTRKAIVALVIPELALVQEGYSLIPTRVVTKQRTHPIMATDTSKPWDIFWCSKLFEAMYELRSKLSWGGGGGGKQAVFPFPIPPPSLNAQSQSLLRRLYTACCLDTRRWLGRLGRDEIRTIGDWDETGCGTARDPLTFVGSLELRQTTSSLRRHIYPYIYTYLTIKHWNSYPDHVRSLLNTLKIFKCKIQHCVYCDD